MGNIVKTWIDLALNDLKSAEVLYSNGLYRASIFSFQQSSEKANKALALFYGEFTEKEIRGTGHDQLKVYRKIIQNIEGKVSELSEKAFYFPKEKMPEYFSSKELNRHKKTLGEDIQSINTLRNADLFVIPVRDINTLLARLEDIKDSRIQVPDDFELQFKTHAQKIVEWISEFDNQEAKEAASELEIILQNENQSKEIYNAIAKQIIPWIFNFSFIIMTFLSCAIITYKHISVSRYPDEGIDPNKFYNKRLPLIKKQPILMGHLYDALKRFQKVAKDA